MFRYNLWLFLATTLMTGHVCAGEFEPAAPKIEHQDKWFLAHVACRACEQYIQEHTLYASPYAPTTLADITCEIVVTIRRDRLLLGVGSAGPGPIVRVTIDTGVCLVAWVEALSVAGAFDDTPRAARYEAAARSVARFVLRLQIREAEASPMRAVADALGGVRTSAADSRLRIENLQYALPGLTEFHRARLAPRAGRHEADARSAARRSARVETRGSGGGAPVDSVDVAR